MGKSTLKKVDERKVSCVICAYNEADRIGVILEVLKNHPLIAEIIVVDDGSTDATKEAVKRYDFARLITLPVNTGKSNALAVGIAAARYGIIALLDADLIGLKKADVTALIEPVISDEADISISLRKNSLPVYKLLGLDFVSGERVFRKSFIESHLETLRTLPGFSVEVFINRLIIEQELRVKIVRWKSVVNPRKSFKYGLMKGAKDDASMISDILKVVSASDIILQNYRILSLTVDR